MPDQIDSTEPADATGGSPLLRNVGVALILLSGVFFFSMISVPWWPIGGGARAAIAGGLFIGMQIAWWAGAAMVGPAAIAKMRSFFRRNQGHDSVP